MTTNPPITDTTPNDAPKGIILSQRAYDVTKDVQMVILPAAGTVYAASAAILHLPYALQVVDLIGVAVFILGVLLKISSVQFQANVKVAVAKAVAQGATVVAINANTGAEATPQEVDASTLVEGTSMDPRNVTG